MTKSSTKQKITEKANFIQHQIPGLESGDYLITAHNEISSTEQGKLPSNEVVISPISYKFAIKGPRYALSPDSVHSVFPPSGSVGIYETVVPQVVLTKKTLPWQRSPLKNPDLAGKFSYKKDGATYTYDQNVASWLAVLLVNENDFNWEGSTVQFKDALQTKASVADLLPGPDDTFVSVLSLQGVKSNGTGLEIGESIDDSLIYVELPTEVFHYIAPSAEDLKSMANVRQVAVANKPTDSASKVPIEQIAVKGSLEDAEDMGVYSIVMGNRLPASGQKHLAVLVSLEEMADYLAPNQLPANATSIRLPVLKSWHFNSQTDTHDFDSIFERLNNGTAGKETLNQAQLKYYPSQPDKLPKDAKAALNFGYIPINHRTRAFKAVDKQTVSWYRGPLSPIAVPTGLVNPTDEGQMLIYHADELLRQNPDTGLFDVSYAAAWQLGQLLALQDKSFSALLYQWKQQTLHNLVLAIDRYLMEQNTDSISDLEKGAAADKLNADFYDGIIYLLKQYATST